jgi:hypothetical protein
MDPDADPGSPKPYGYTTLALTCWDVRLWCTGKYLRLYCGPHIQKASTYQWNMELYISEICLIVQIPPLRVIAYCNITAL